MQTESRPTSAVPKVVLGMVFIAFGILLLLSNLQVINGEKILFYWPLFTFVPFGLERLFSKGFLRSTLGHLLIFLGVFFQIVMMKTWVLLEKGWPITLLWIGLVLTFRSIQEKRAEATKPE